MTYGYGVNPSEKWIHLLSQSLDQPVLNLGVTGDTTSGMLARFHNYINPEIGRKVLIIGGVNDLIMGVEPSNVISNLSAIVFGALSKGLVPVLATVLPVSKEASMNWEYIHNVTWLNQKIDQLNKEILRFSRTYDVSCVDLSSIVMKSAGDSEIFLDGIHLNKAGHKLFYEVCKANL